MRKIVANFLVSRSVWKCLPGKRQSLQKYFISMSQLRVFLKQFNNFYRRLKSHNFLRKRKSDSGKQQYHRTHCWTLVTLLLCNIKNIRMIWERCSKLAIKEIIFWELLESIVNFGHNPTLTYLFPMLHFYNPGKYQKTWRFSDVFRGY